MSAKKTRLPSGLTLVEIVVAMVVIMVAIIGAMGYRYYSILDARKAKVHITAARLGSVLLENWKGSGGRSTARAEFDPRYLNFGSRQMLSAPSEAGPLAPNDFNLFGKYAFIVDGATYYASLFYADEITNDLRVLNVCVGWPNRYPSGNYSSTDQLAALQSIRLTTKVNIPDS